MSKNKSATNHRFRSLAIPSGLKPFPFISTRGNVPKTPIAGDGKYSNPLTLVSAAEWASDESLGNRQIANDDDRGKGLLRLIHQLESGGDVSDDAIRMAIGAHAWKGFRAEAKQLSPSPMPRHIASVLYKYAELLRVADDLYRRAERNGSTYCTEIEYVGLRPKKSIHNQAANAYERALEFLDEECSEQPGMVTWLDRPYMAGHETTASPDPEGVPRLITSRSPYANTLTQKKRMLKLRTLKYCLSGAMQAEKFAPDSLALRASQ